MSEHEPTDHSELEAWVDHLYEASDREICRILGAYIDRLHAIDNPELTDSDV